MKKLKIFRYILLVALIGSLLHCSREPVAVDHTDDHAFPPPVLKLDNTELEKVNYKEDATIEGTVESKNGLRDLYITLMKKVEDEYVEIDKNHRVYQSFDGFPENQNISLEINISDKETAAVGVVANDIYTKTTEENVIIGQLIGIPPVIEVSPQQIDEVELNESVTVSGTASSNAGIKSVTYALAVKSPYAELSEPVEISLSPGETEKEFSFEIVVDNDRADAISVVVTDVDDVKETAFVDIHKITGVPEGRALIFDRVEMAPEWENPDKPSEPYIFSFDGVVVNGQLKNILTLNDLIVATSGKIDFAFVNFWRNSNHVTIANRGPGFASADRITGGTVGRQVDAPWLTIDMNSTFFKLIPPEMAEQMDLDDFFENTPGNWETFQELEALSSFVTGASNGDKQILQRIEASSDRASPSELQIVDGSYIAIRRQYDGNVKYGIIQVIEAVDDTKAINEDGKITGINSEPGVSQYYTGPDLDEFEYSGVTTLYGKKCVLKIIVQQ